MPSADVTDRLNGLQVATLCAAALALANATLAALTLPRRAIGGLADRSVGESLERTSGPSTPRPQAE